MCIFVFFVFVLLLVLMVFVQSIVQFSEYQCYFVCMEWIEIEVVEVYEDVLVWKYDGGGWLVEYCQVWVLIVVGDLYIGVSLFESIVLLECLGLLMQECLDMWFEVGVIWLEIEDFEVVECSFVVVLVLVELLLYVMLGYVNVFLGQE